MARDSKNRSSSSSATWKATERVRAFNIRPSNESTEVEATGEVIHLFATRALAHIGLLAAELRTQDFQKAKRPDATLCVVKMSASTTHVPFRQAVQ